MPLDFIILILGGVTYKFCRCRAQHLSRVRAIARELNDQQVQSAELPIMACCLNPDCTQPVNLEGNKYCQHCDTALVALLRNRYKVLNPLSKGGFGKTFLAEDIDKLNDRCVVKQLI